MKLIPRTTSFSEVVRGISDLGSQDVDSLSVGFCVLHGAAGAAGGSVPHGDHQSAVVDHIPIAALKAIPAVMGLEQGNLVAPLEDCLISAAALIGPVEGLITAGQNALQRDGVIPLQLQHHFCCPGVHPLGHTREKIVDVMIVDGT